MARKLSSWWPKWSKRFDGITERGSFHSLRRNVIQSLVAAGVEGVVIKQLAGHADDSITTGTYGRRLDVTQLADAIGKLDFSKEVHALRSTPTP